MGAVPASFAVATPTFPVHDWQFWIATLVVLAILGRIVWRVVRALRPRRPGATVKATLTIGGESVRRQKS